MRLALVSISMGNMIKSKSLKQWLEANWNKVLGYTPICHILVRGWICFEMRSEIDLEFVFKQD